MKESYIAHGGTSYQINIGVILIETAICCLCNFCFPTELVSYSETSHSVHVDQDMCLLGDH